jgi:uncharacterized delta-60 repeat protein/CSLREA domain-containing protein
VAGIGDLDGDGTADIAVGAIGDDDGGDARGAVHILFLNPDGTIRAEQKISDTQGGLTAILDNNDQLGTSVAGIGDLDADGTPDIAIGARFDDNRGAIHILFLNPDGTVRAEQKISDTEGGLTAILDDNDQFGTSVAGIGDLDSDGTPDIAVGVARDDDGGTDRGAVYVLFLNANGTVRDEQKISDTQGAFSATLDDNDQFGISVSGLGDLDGDGTIGLAIGAWLDDDGGTDRGAIYILDLSEFNNAPVLDNTGTMTFTTITEDDFTNNGNTVAEIIASAGGDRITDADGDPEGIIWTGHNQGTHNGWFEYSLDGGTTWTRYGWYRNGLLLRDTDRIRFVPTGFGAEGASITFRAWDQTLGSAGDVLRTYATGGTAAISAATGTATITATAVNDAPTFGRTAAGTVGEAGDGVTIHDIDGRGATYLDVASLGDGSTLAVGYVDTPAAVGNDDVLLVKYASDGTIDTTFGTDGYVLVPLGSGNDEAHAVAIQTDGRIVVAGRTFAANWNGFIARFTADGQLDPTFASGAGYVTVDNAGALDQLFGVDVHTDGTITAAGRTGTSSLLAVRTLANGTLDTTFDTDGIAVLAGVRGAADAAVDSSGRLVVATDVSVTRDLAAARLTTAGALDTTFDGDGIAATDLGLPTADSWGTGIAIQPDGRIVVTGYSWDDGAPTWQDDLARIPVVRFDSDGSLDTTFGGGNGYVLTDVPDGAYWGGMEDVAIQSDGSIVTAGFFDLGYKGQNDVIVARHLSDGTLDSSFADGGFAMTPTLRYWNYFYGVTIATDGDVVAVGYADSLLGLHVRYDGTDGSLPTGFVTQPLDGAPTYVIGSTAVVLDDDVTVVDHELDSGNYGGASLVIERAGGASSDDVFEATGALGPLTEGGSLVIGGNTIGTVTTNSAGTLRLDFTGTAAWGSRLRAVLTSIAYRNTAGTPSTVTLDWTFSDGNTLGAQGSGGEKFATGQTVVTVTDFVATVNSTGDASDASPGDGVCDTGGTNSEGDPECTLRAAIEEANALGGGSVNFGIPNSDPGHVYYRDNAAAGFAAPVTTTLDDASISDFDSDYPLTPFSWWRISPATVLPTITAPVTIDGFTQPGSQPNTVTDWGPTDAVWRVEIDNPSVNLAHGLRITAGSTTVRGLAIDEGEDAIAIDGAGANSIVGNLLGPDISGESTGSATWRGVGIAATAAGANTIGGVAAADRNIIGHTSSYGVYLAGDGNTVVNNLLGFGVLGTDLLSIQNQDTGVWLEGGSGNQIGAVGAGNVFGRNIDSGIWSQSGASNNSIQANTFIANRDTAISLTAGSNDNLIGGVAAGEGNTFTGTVAVPGSAVAVDGTSTGNAILGNSMVDNDGLGIDLGDAYGDGVTANDPGDVDTGANDLLNFPVITSAVDTAGTLDVTFSLDVPAGNYRVEFFANPSGADPTGYGEGEVFVHAVTVSHPGTGSQSFAASFAGAAGDIIASTTTEDLGAGSFGSTSEFSAVLEASAPPVAVDDTLATDEDTAGTVDVLANDTDADGDPLSVTDVTNGTNGTVANNGDGTVTYTPAQDWNGVDSFAYTISDGRGGSDTATVTVTVTAVNDAPVAVDDADSIAEDGSSTVDVLANDTDVDNDPLTVVSVTQGANGTVADNGDGTVTYTPAADWNGVDFYTYTVSDGELTDTATVTVTVTAINDAPVAVDDNTGTDEDTPVVITPLANDTDVDGDSLSVDSFTQPANGTVTDNGDDTLTYTPDGDWNGTDSFTYTVTDGQATDSATVWVVVAPVNDAPVAADDSVSTDEDTPVTVSPLDNDADVDGPALVISAVTQGANGSVVDNGDGTLTYTPDPDWNGVDTFEYTVSDGSLTDTATVTVIVGGVNDAPVAVDDADTISEDGSSTVDVLANDIDVDGDALTVTSVTQGANGSVVDNGDGTITYTPDPDWNGVDTYTYTVSDGVLADTATVTVTVTAVNDFPVAADDADSIAEDGSSTVDVLANDSDVDGDLLFVLSVTQPAHGTVIDNGDGTITYTPDPDWNGVDSYTYLVSDGALTDSATVTVTVTAVNDAPVAVDDSDSIAEDGVSTIDVLANDTDVDGDTLTIASLTQGANGSVTDNGDGTVTYTPAADWNGVDVYTYTVTDGVLTDVGTVTITVTAVNDAPVAGDDADAIAEDGWSTVDVLANDTDVDNDPLTVVSVTQGANGSVVDNGDGTITYTPDPDWNGVDFYTYTVSDGELTDTATVTVTVTAVNDAPVAVDDADTILEDGSSTVDVLANDTDVENDSLTVVSVTQGANGSVVDNGDGTITYTPAADWNGVDSYTYTVSDGTDTDTGTVTITVLAVNDAPVAVVDNAVVAEDGSVAIDPIANDTDTEGDLLGLVSFGQGGNGAVTDNGDGTLTYTPDPDWNGTDSFTYIVGDGALTDTGTVWVVVTPVNDAPVAVDDTDSIIEDGVSTVDVLANDIDVDGDTLTVTSVTQGANGSVVDNGDGTLTYTPDLDFNGLDSYTYTVSDGLLTDTATVTISVGADNDAPVAVDDADTIAEDGSSILDVLANDTDVDGDILAVTSITQGANGTVVDNGDGTLTYTPDADWNGVDSYTYTVSDGFLTDTATVTITVTPVNDFPVAADDAGTLDEDTFLTLDLVANDTDVDGDTLVIVAVTQPANGSVVDNGDGTVTYTPDPDWNGVDTFSYTVTDGALTAGATVTMTVTAVNDAPVGGADADVIAEDGSSTIPVLGNDTDVENDPLTVVAVTQGANGTVTDNGDGTITYTPDPDWNGVDTYTYTVSDGELTDTATVTVTVTAVNDAPVAVDDADTILEDGSSTVDVLANDTDVENDPLTVVSVTQGANGSVTDNGDGTITYTPDPDWNGVDSYTYTVSDGELTDTATVTVTVTAVNDAPVAVDDADSILEDGVSTLDVLVNDYDVDGTPVVTGVTQGANGSVVDNGDGTVTYTPAADWNGVDSYTYTVSDGELTDTATVTVTVTAVNDAPVAVDDADTILEDGSSTVDVLANDTDVENDPLTVVSVTQGANGSVTDNGDGTITYTPDPDWNGVDSYTYTVSDGALTDTATVTVTVTAVNDAPVAVDDADSIAEDGSSTVDVLANDTDVENDPLTVVSVTQGMNGSVVDNGDGTVTYTPDPDWNGVDFYTYTVSDGELTDTATVTVTVTAINDAPVAVDDNTGTDEDTPVVITPLANDTDVDGDSLSVDSFTQPANGTVTDNGDDTLTYTPDGDWNGTDSFTYTVTDGQATDSATVWVVVAPVNDAPVAADEAVSTDEDTAVVISVLANDFDVDGDILTVESVTQGSNGTVADNGDGTVTYTPAQDWNGTDSFTYTVTDGALTDTATVTVVVGGVNDAPVAVDDVDTVTEDGSVIVDVVANDTDVDGDALAVVSVTQGANGSVTDNGDGTVTYTPDPDWNGVDSFTYTVSDGVLTDTATVTITVTAVNDAPVAVDDADSIPEDGSSTVDVLANDLDVDGDVVFVVSVVQPANGMVVDNGDGTLTYTPDPDWHGVDSFSYLISDGALTATATVTITVTAVNDAPVAVDDADTIPEDGSSTIDPIANDSDVDGDTLSVESVTQAANGTVVINGDGTVTYTPNADWHGTDLYTVTVSDGNGGVATSQVTVTVTPVNDAPVAVPDAIAVAEDTPTIVDVVANDYDVDGDPLFVVSATANRGGSVTMLGAHTIIYTPARDFTGAETVTYVVSDGNLTAVGTLSVTVLPVNDNVVAVNDNAIIDEDGSILIDVLANDIDVDGDVLSIVSFTQTTGAVVTRVGSQLRFVPERDRNGVFQFTYTVSDGASASVGLVTVTVRPVNDPPVAIPDSVSVAEDTAIIIDVLANDIDVDGDRLFIAGVSAVVNGTATVTADGRIRFLPAADFNGVATFDYTVTDGIATAWTTVTIGVLPVNDAPVAGTQSFSVPHTSEAGTVVGRVVATDPEGSALVFSGSADGLTIAPDGTIVLTDQFEAGQVLAMLVQVRDSQGATTSFWVTVTITEGNRAPVISDRSIEVPADFRDGEVVVAMSASDPDGDPLTWTMKGGPGWSIGAKTGQVVKGVLPGVGQTLAIPVTVTDPAGLSDTALLTILVVEPVTTNRPPVAVPDRWVIQERELLVLDPLANDSDPDGDSLSFRLTSLPVNGSIIEDDGTVLYQPNRTWHGTEQLSYRVSDGRGGSAEATITIVVEFVNDPPVVARMAAEVPAGQASRLQVPPVAEPDGQSYTIELGSVDRATVELVGDEIVFTPEEGLEGSTEFEVRATDELGAVGVGGYVLDVVVGKTSVSVEVLSSGAAQPAIDIEEAARNASPGGLALFMPSVTEALSAVWASRIPLLALLGLLALSLFGSRRLHIRLGTTPLRIPGENGRSWSVVLVQEGHALPVFSGPDRANEVVANLHPLRCDLRGTGELSQTGGVIWVEIESGGISGWVEASHVVANPLDPLPMSAVANALEHLVGAVRGEAGLEGWVSGRGLFVAHHAPPFRLTRKRVEGAMVDPTPFRWWDAKGTQPDVMGSFGEVVVAPLLEAMVETAGMELSTVPVPGEVLYEFTNFETVALGLPETGWILCFERGLDGLPLLVGVMKRGRSTRPRWCWSRSDAVSSRRVRAVLVPEIGEPVDQAEETSPDHVAQGGGPDVSDGGDDPEIEQSWRARAHPERRLRELLEGESVRDEEHVGHRVLQVHRHEGGDGKDDGEDGVGHAPRSGGQPYRQANQHVGEDAAQHHHRERHRRLGRSCLDRSDRDYAVALGMESGSERQRHQQQ